MADGLKLLNHVLLIRQPLLKSASGLDAVSCSLQRMEHCDGLMSAGYIFVHMFVVPSGKMLKM